MSSGITPPYKAFGDLIVQYRNKAGFAQQSDLAGLMKTSQQTVSRWESGKSRPRDKQMPLLASVLMADLDELLAAAGYTTTMPVATFDKPFPIDALNPDSFERFCLYFLSEMYPDANVHRVGGQGHTQDGLDVEVIFNDGTSYSFQCKRVNEFGPRKVHGAVAKHTRLAKKKYLLLSRPAASPQSRQAIREYDDWDIWDREDVSRIIRQQLTKDQQLRLVDTFFSGQRLTLLGETEAGPWQTNKQFFDAFTTGEKVFSHQWELVGRRSEVTDLVNSLSNSSIRAIFLISPGGGGKSRLLKQVVEIFERSKKAVLVRFLSPTENVTDKSLEDLGRGEKLLVVDDAHDREDLQLLFQYASSLGNNTTLLLAFRPYGLDYIKGQASNFALTSEFVSEIKLNPLNLDQATQLATQVLNAFNGPVDSSKDIARLTRDCPLFTVIGAQVVAKENVHLELAKNEDVFRSILLGRFRDIIAGHVGSKSDVESIKKLLNILALIQPFNPEDESIALLVEQVEGLRIQDVNRLIRLLIDAGVLFKRGGKYRLSPDLLADYIIERVCIGENGSSTGYAEQVFNAVNITYIEHILVNLGKLDWRRENGDPSNSRLLEGVWKKIKPSSEYSDPYINAVTSVAFYQPERALNYAEMLIRNGSYLSELPNLIKHAAYNIKHLPRACECLWELGKSDDRALHQHPGHAIRILSELCAVEPNKPIEYNAVVVEYGLSLLDQEESWEHAYTPLDLLKGILQTEGHTTTSNGRSINFSPFLVNASAVSSLRKKVIDTTINLLTYTNKKVAVLAAKFLHEGLRYPMGVMNIQISSETHDLWSEEFVNTLVKIEEKIKTSEVDPLVLIELIRSVSWHAHYTKGETSTLAKQIIALLPDSLEFRATLALVDGYGYLLERMDYEQHEREWNQFLISLTNDLLSEYPDGDKLRVFIENILANIDQNYVGGNAFPEILYGRLIESSIALAQATVKNALQDKGTKTIKFAGIALSKILRDDHAYGLKFTRNFIESESLELHTAVGRAYSALDWKNDDYREEDLALLRFVLSSKEEWVVKNGVRAVQSLAQKSKTLAIDLLKCVDIGISNNVADDVLFLFERDEIIPFRLLSDETIAHFLKKIFQIPELDGHWIESFLSKVSRYHARLAAKFFMDRVEYAARLGDWQYRPCNYGPYLHVPLRFRESEEFGSLLRQVYQWMITNSDKGYHFEYCAGELFNTMFSPLDNELLGYIQAWVDLSTPDDMRMISHILRESRPKFIFDHRAFVNRYLEKAKQHGKGVLDSAINALYNSATTGLKSGTPGEPFPEDILIRNEAEKALQEIPRFSSSYALYEALKKHAEADINRSLRERETFEDD